MGGVEHLSTFFERYIENPKTKGSGILCCIPQTGRCPNQCEDCFFQSGRSYLEPLDENLPNMVPVELARTHVVRVNDGNDSNVNRNLVIESTREYPNKFYNTAIPKSLGLFDAPVVLTLNPGKDTDQTFHKLDPAPPNLMFVRFRTNMWNLPLLDEAVKWYSELGIPTILTFMAYYAESIPADYRDFYTYRKRTLNSYWAITTNAWRTVMDRYKGTVYEKWVYSCSKVEGEDGTSLCKFCGNCLREYYNTKERMA